jgi:hypothetical protein
MLGRARPPQRGGVASCEKPVSGYPQPAPKSPRKYNLVRRLSLNAEARRSRGELATCFSPLSPLLRASASNARSRVQLILAGILTVFEASLRERLNMSRSHECERCTQAPKGRHGFGQSPCPCGPPKAMKPRGVQEFSTNFGKAGRGPAADQGGPPYFATAYEDANG